MEKKSRRKITYAAEDYLKAIYFLQMQNDNVRVTDLADKLSVSKPSVTRAVNKLKQKSFVEHENYGLLKLTEKGFLYAENIVMRHDVLIKFLCDLLGVEKNLARIEACKLEHAMSNATINKLKRYLHEVGI